MSLDKFFNLKSKVQPEKMDIQNPQKQSSLPWVQKYRPNKLQEISYQQQVVKSLTNVLKTGNLPHLLFYGPAGTGKTSTIIALSKQLFGYFNKNIVQNFTKKEYFNQMLLIKEVLMQSDKKQKDLHNLYVLKTQTILDQADLMTVDAQSALRRVIQDNSSTTRFCIICNYITKIIEPLSSRCVKFRFASIPQQAQIKKLKDICIQQKVRLNQNQIYSLLQKGDLRQSINSLQSFHKLSSIPSFLLPVSQQIGEIILNSINKCTDIRKVFQIGQEIGYQGYAYDEILNSLSRAILKKERNQKRKALILQTLSKAQQNLVLGATQLPIIQVLTSIYYISHMNV